TSLFLLLAWSCTGHSLEIPAPRPTEPGTQGPEQPGEPSAKVVRVASAADVAALGEVAAGTEIVWSSGTYADQTVTLKSAGTAANPVVLRAEEPGDVRFTGASRLTVKGSYAVVDGFWWQNPEAVKGKAVITLDRGSECCTVEQCAVTGDATAEAAGIDAKWVSLYGRGHTVTRCTFRDKRNMGTLLVVWLEADIVPRHRIVANRFERPVTLCGDDGKPLNGQETIRIGTSDTSMQDAECTVEDNWFYHCHGEQAEIVSNKSCANIYRGNLFEQSRGSLTLRHGNRCLVTGNYFLGDGLDGTGGVRIIGEDHTVENNYMERLRGTGYKTALCLVRGQKDPALSGYWQVRRAVVRRNVIVDCRYAFQVNYGSSTQTEPVVETTIENNTVSLSSSGDYAVNCATNPAPDIEWRGNTIYGGRLSGVSLPIAAEAPTLPDVTGATSEIRRNAGVGW
ncbi:MAG: polysaccharide lyase 6 family protein, partial [Alistipes sp.]|nr:polysaccharide lyase 6 family protein [Alistipes sp.]